MIGIILAGGAATRMGGGDKGLLRIGDQPILERVVATLRVQCDDILISANGDPARFARFDCVVVADDRPERRGPLAGLLAGLDHVARHHPGASFVVTAPTDTPFLPPDLVARLEAARRAGDASIACARSAGRVHPVVALWSIGLAEDLRRALDEERLRKVRAFLDRHAPAYADWPVAPFDPFFNVNDPAELAAAASILRDLSCPGNSQSPPRKVEWPRSP